MHKSGENCKRTARFFSNILCIIKPFFSMGCANLQVLEKLYETAENRMQPALKDL
jgi:hypothetical protein